MWYIVVGILAFVAGMIYGEYRSVEKSQQLLARAQQLCTEARADVKCSRAVLETINALLFPETAEQD